MFVEACFTLLLLLAYFIIRDRKPSNMPPGPFEIPFIGNKMVVRGAQAMELQKKYGDIVTIRFGNRRSVLLFDPLTVRESMARADLTSRPSIFDGYSLDDQGTGGVTMTRGLQWQHDRRFLLRNLRDLGMGKSYLEEAITIEARALVEYLKKSAGTPTDSSDSFRTVALNVIWQMIAGHRYDLDDQSEVKAIYEAAKRLNESGVFFLLKDLFPILKCVPTFLQNQFLKGNRLQEYMVQMSKLVNATVKSHEESFNPDSPRDMIDQYLLEMGDQSKSEDEKRFLRKGALRQIITDCIDAGSDTISVTLRWAVFLMARFPDTLKRLQKEIDNVVPHGSMVSYGDRSRLGYVEAWVSEAIRYSSFFILNLDHTSEEDITIGGYNVPKGTSVQPVVYAFHYNPKTWTDPNTFRPERFLDEDGKYQSSKEGFYAFASGKRSCPGEQLARTELFFFISAIAHHFDVLLPKGVVIDDDKEKPVVAFFILPDPTPLVYRARDFKDY